MRGRNPVLQVLLFIFFMTFIASAPAHAYNILTLDMGGYWNNLTNQYIGAQQGYGTPHAVGERWFTTVAPSQLSQVNLLDYDVFLVQSGFTDDNVLQPATAALAALSADQLAIADYVQAGHGLVAWSEPMPDGAAHLWDWAPVAVQSQGVFHENTVHINDPQHPIMQGSTDARLSDWHSSWHGYFDSFDPRLSAIASTGDYGLGDPRTDRALTLAGSYWSCGGGRMVFSMQDPDFHAYQQAPFDDRAATFITHSLDWAEQNPCSSVPEPATWSLIGIGVLGFALNRLRGRGGRGPSATE